MKRVIIGAIVGGIVLFVWQFAAWAFLDIHALDNDPVLEDEAAVVEALEGNEKGVYWIPGATQAVIDKMEGPEYEDWEERHKKGPRAFVVYDPEGAPPMEPKLMVIGGALAIVSAFVVSLLLRAAAIRSYFGRVLFVAGIGLFLATNVDLQMWNWANHPADFTVGWIVDHVGGMAILGVVLGLIVKPED